MAAATLAGTSALADLEDEQQLEQPAHRKPSSAGGASTGTAAAGAGAASDVVALPPRAPPSATHLAYLVGQCRPCVLRPFCFFVSWSGVLALAYRGFPRQLAGLKAALPEYYAGLPPEAPGSRWPKTTLAALRDGRRLTPEQLATLSRICWCACACMRAVMCVCLWGGGSVILPLSAAVSSADAPCAPCPRTLTTASAAASSSRRRRPSSRRCSSTASLPSCTSAARSSARSAAR